jgi:hypothetical protein
MKKISMTEIAGSDVLAKMAFGRSMLRKLLEANEVEPGAPEPVFLDFEAVNAATSSFLRECVLGFRDATRGRRSNFYPVIANADEGVEEELDYLLRGQNDAMLGCLLSDTDRITALHLIGELDPNYRQTFELVMRLGETDAGTLLRDYGGPETVTRTAWNNRLAALSAMSLVVEVSHGRSKRYTPVLQET